VDAQMIDKHEAAARASGGAIVFPADMIRCRSNSACSARRRRREVFGAPAARVKGRVRAMTGRFGRTAASMKGDLHGGRQ